ncbi:MAG: Xaa-Pro peptidase family protein [Acidobacteriota bacterium]
MAGVLDRLLDEAGVEALVITSRSVRDPYLAPFLGGGRLGYALLVAARGRRPLLGFLSPMERDEAARSGLDLLPPDQLDVQRYSRDGAAPDALWAGVLERALQWAELSASAGPVALAGTMPAGILAGVCRRLAAVGWHFEPGEAIADRYRKVKSAAQLESIRSASEGTSAAMRRVASMLAESAADPDGALTLGGEPLRVGTLRSAVAQTLAAHHLEQPEGNIIAPAEEGAVPHTVGTDSRQLRAGESLVVDIFPRGEMFSDCTRTFCVGEPSPELDRGYRAVLAALEHAEGRAAPGTSGWQLHSEVCDLFEAAGYRTSASHRGTERGYVHGLGHGVGFELHELPSFREHAEDGEGALEVGDVLTLEPGLYEPDERWAVRLEDLYAVEGDGVRSLTPLPRHLDPRRWPPT